ncbi:hypothetical protein NLJ89_g10012 [Agrocybe chaxingu]|uniref:DUF1776-domain-containing protein n=1 Tax=Agrocybe chaxingu TaxID=84603 RepID=A0A9W8JPM6_9AGAR|nr:hypothetical protein NLJ89_g10012 [Agrocybe chaxingu]
MPSLDSVEEYLQSVEEYFYSSLSAVTYSLPDVQEVVNQLWVDISRYGPGMPAFPEVHIPTLGDFQVPPPPPPPPPPPSWIEQSASLAGRHPWKTTGIVIGVVGAGLLVGYRHSVAKRSRRLYTSQKVHSDERRQIVVVLGGDGPYALPLILELEKKGYIVVASVATAEAADALEARCHGYVKAHILDPFEPATIPAFLRSFSATLSRKFPINSPGDPYASPSSIPYVHSIISLLSLSAAVPSINAPLEHISLRDTYLPYLTATQITPLQVIQSLLPLLRTGSARGRDYGKKSIIVCLPATDVRVGLPFASIQAMSAAGTLRAVEVLRREINVASLTEKSDSMQNTKVVVVDVGAFDTGVATKSVLSEGIYKSMEDWTASEKVAYGPAFVSVMDEKPLVRSRWEGFKPIFRTNYKYGSPRQPSDLSVFAESLVGVVSGGRYVPSLFGLGLGLGRIRNWIRGERFSIGAGASTYKIASYLPSILLDALLNLPHFLIGIRNRLLPVAPYHRPPTNLPSPVNAKKVNPEVESKEVSSRSTSPDVETSSDADVESNAGDTVASSWVSLHKKQASEG